VIVVHLGCWLFAPLLLLAFFDLPAFQLFTESLALRVQLLPHPCSQGQVQHSTLTSTVLEYSLLFKLCRFVKEMFISLDYVPGGGVVGESCMVMIFTCSLCRFMQAAFEPSGKEK
jgi:hypothetical protein